MKKLSTLNVITTMFLVGLMTTPCQVMANQEPLATREMPTEKAEQAATHIYKGKINGVSKKAKSIMLTVGKGKKAKTIMLKFDHQTEGLAYAQKGEAAIITYEIKGRDKVAQTIKPKLAKLPAGVTEMHPEELVALIKTAKTDQKKYLLLDARPASRFAAGHVPTSLSLPVSKFKKLAGTVLPDDKSFPLIFLCGGPT